MKKWFALAALAASLSACTSTGGGQSQIYGEISGGVETSRTRIGN